MGVLNKNDGTCPEKIITGGGVVKLCGFDLETPQDEPSWGLQPWRARTDGATIKSVAVYFSDGSNKTVRMPTKAWLKDFLRFCADAKITLVGWNLLFDIAWLHAIGLTKEVNACTWMDALLLLKRVDGWKNRELGGKGYGLKTEVARRWPEHADYGLGDDVIKVPQTEEEWARFLEYNLKDAEFTTLLAMEYLEQLSPEEQRAARQEALGLSPIALSAINGISVNLVALFELKKDVAIRRAEAEAKLNVPASVIASPKQLAKLLYEDWGFGVVNTTPKGVPSTDKEALLTLELEYPEDVRLRALLDVRKCNTQQAKFVDAVLASVKYHGESVTRPSPILSGTYSGRLTYGSNQGKGKAQIQTGIALHQWERGKAARSILTAPEGFVIAEFDASGQEMRLMADASQDEMMLKLFNDGIDGHAYMGAQIEGKEWQWVSGEQDKDPEAKRIRNLGKFANLSLQYRISADSIRVRALTQYGLNIGAAKAQKIKDTYLKTYPGVPRFWKSAVRLAAKNGFAETRGHRRIRLHNLNIYEQQQTAINFPIQGTGADMKTLAIAVLRTEFNDDVMYAWDLHDALFLYVRDDGRALETVKRIRQKLDALPYMQAWGWAPSVALPWDSKAGWSWGSLKGV